MIASVDFSPKTQWIEKLTNHRVPFPFKEKNYFLAIVLNSSENYLKEFTSHNSNGDYAWLTTTVNNTLPHRSEHNVIVWHRRWSNDRLKHQCQTIWLTSNQPTTTLAHSLLSVIFLVFVSLSNYVKTNIFILCATHVLNNNANGLIGKLAESPQHAQLCLRMKISEVISFKLITQDNFGNDLPVWCCLYWHTLPQSNRIESSSFQIESIHSLATYLFV